MPDKIMLIDGNSIINRAFYALPVLTNSNGEYTNAVYGFFNIFFKLYDEEQPKYLTVAFDLPKPTFRHIKFAEYKGTRKSMPEELRPQIALLKNMLTKMRIGISELEGYEADDILGTLAQKASSQGLEVVIISGDRDLLQLASESIKVRIPKTKAGKTEIEDYFAKDVLEKIGVSPKEYIDVKALMGDTSDNIPGVPGIGEKTALKIIQEYGSIESAIENAANIKPKRASENLSIHEDLARLSKELATIIVNAPTELKLEEVSRETMCNDEAHEEAVRLEFKNLINRFNMPSVPVNKKVQHKFSFIDSEDKAKTLVDTLMDKEKIFLSCVVLDSFAGIAFCADSTEAVYVPEEYIQEFDKVLSSRIPKILLDSKRDMHLLRKKGLKIANIVFDASLAFYILNSSKASYFYNDIAHVFLNEDYPSVEEIIGKGKKKSKPDFENLCQYACLQAEVAYKSYPILKDKLHAQNQDELYYEIELPLAEVLFDMENFGLKVDKDALFKYGESLDIHITELTQQIYDLSGEEFNINSPIQLGNVLFEKLGLKGTKKTTHGYSTAAEVLEKLVDKHPIIKIILEYRSYAKLKSTYVDGLLAVVDNETSKIYSTFNQTIASTGRLSSTEPNLQNIPIRLPLGRELRKVFIPTDESFVFLGGDYSQIELRVLAHMSEDEVLIKAFQEDQDIHRLTASQVFNTPFDEVTSEQRGNAKAVNFGIVYGISSFSLSQDLNITKKEADKYIAGYFKKYPMVKKFLDNSISSAKDKGYAETISNRRRSIPELKASNFVTRSFGERVAMNMPVQGSAADIIKIAMIRVHKRLKKENLESRLILQIHDELLLEVKKNELDIVRQLLKEEMEQAVGLKVPIETDFHEGVTWYDAK